MLDKVAYQKQMGVILDHSGGNFYLIRPEHSRYLNGDGNAVLILSYILNLLRMKNSNTKDRKRLRQEEMWFRCPAGLIQQTLGMWDKKQRRAIRALEDSQLLELSHRAGKVLWVKVNTDTLESVSDGTAINKSSSVKTTDPESDRLKQPIRPVKTTDPVRLKQPNPCNTNKPSKKHAKETPCPSQAQDEENESNKNNSTREAIRTSKAKKWANLIWRRLDEVRLLNRNRSRFPEWVKHFEYLQRRGPKEGPHASNDEIDYYLKELLPYISVDMDKEYWPVVHSAGAFCDKFHQVKRQVDKKKRLLKEKETKKIEEESGFFRDKQGGLCLRDSDGVKRIPAQDEWRYSVPEHLRIPERME